MNFYIFMLSVKPSGIVWSYFFSSTAFVLFVVICLSFLLVLYILVPESS